MARHLFNLQLSATYESSDNKVASLDVRVKNEDSWEPFELNTLTPGFLVYVYSMFTCQHLFLRTNSTECGITLANCRGEIRVETSDDWHLEIVDVGFDVNLRSGDADEEMTNHIISRMQQCPVSKNFPATAKTQTRVVFHHEQ